MVYRKIRNFPMALDYFISALEMLRRILPDEHSDIAGCLWSTGIVYARQKDYDAALQCYFDALKISDKVFPVGHKTTSKLFFLIVCIYIEKEDYEGALHICQQKLNDISEVLGDMHPSIGNLFLQIGDILRKYCNNDEALLYYEKALTIFYHCNPPELYDITHSLNRIALLQEENQNFQLALDNYMKELEIKQKLYLVDQPRTGYTLRNIGRIYLKLKDYANAMKYFEDALNIFKARYSNDHDEIKSTLDFINEVKVAVSSN
jgi:tetratricopeptide (TPR) repeat protein